MPLINQYKSFSQKKPWTARVVLTLLVIVILLTLVRASLSTTIKIGATQWLESQGIEASIGNIEIYIINSSFALNDISGKNKAGKGFSLGRFSANWQWKPLFDNNFVIDQIEIKSLKADAMFFTSGDMNIAGLPIKATAEDTQPEVREETNATPWSAILNSVAISDIELCLQQLADTDQPYLDYCGKLSNFNWQGEISFKPSAQTKTQGAIPLYVKGTLNLENIELHNNLLDLDLLNVASVDINSINTETLNKIAIDKVSIESFSALQRTDQKESANAQVFSFEQLNVEPLELSDLNNLTIGVIELTGSSAYFQINKDGSMEFEQWRPESPEAAPQEKADAAETSSKPFHISLNEFIFTSKRQLIYTDNSLEEPFTTSIHDIDLKFSKFDNSMPEQLSHILLTLGVDKHATLKLDADINPLSDRPSIKGKGEIGGLDLRMIAPMTKKAMGQNIKSGQLDAELNINVDKGIMDSNLDLALHQFKLKALNKKDAEKLDSEFGLPVNTSLSLLRDKNNTIHLEIPITGDINNPSFNPRDALVQATSKAITATVLYYYTPFGLVFATETLFDLATAVRFEPILYDAGEKELKATHEDQLQKMATLLVERPGIHLTLCGFSNDKDREKLFPGSVSDAEKSVAKPLSEKELATLEKLAESRSSSVKSYLVNKKSADSKQLIECAPEYLADEISGVDISLE